MADPVDPDFPARADPQTAGHTQAPTIDLIGGVARFLAGIPARSRRAWGIAHLWVRMIGRGETVGLASQISFEMIFLLAPGMLFFTALLGFFGTDPSTLRAIAELLKGFLPTSLHEIVDRQIAGVILTGSSGKIFFWGMGLATYLGMVLIGTISHALNRGHGIHHSRGWFGRQVIAVFLMFWFCLIIFGSFNILVFGEQVAAAAETAFRLNYSLTEWVRWMKIPVVLGALTLLALMLYLLTVDVYQRVSEALPGALFFAVGWLIATHLFRVYVENFAQYSQLYLALAGFIVLAIWAWVTSFLLLTGAKLNSALREFDESPEATAAAAKLPA